jgi:RNA-splicing ligase RtcB
VKTTYYIGEDDVEDNAKEQISNTEQFESIDKIAVYPDIHYCDEKAIPVGLAFATTDTILPLITGKDAGCGVAYLRIPKKDMLKPFDKTEHYNALSHYQNLFTDERLGGGNHFLSLEEDDNNLYILCHTGTRNLGIHAFQSNYGILQEHGHNQIGIGELLSVKPNWFEDYEKIIQYGKKRRIEFCYKTLQFLINNSYVRGEKNKDYLKGVNAGDFGYEYGDSVHNHIKKEGDRYIHRKGSTELNNDTIVIPLSMTRGSLLVKKAYEDENSLNSCAHGAGRKLSRTDTLKYWHSSLKDKERKEFPITAKHLAKSFHVFSNGYLQEFDFAYKDSANILANQPYLKKVTETRPIVTFKFTEI